MVCSTTHKATTSLNDKHVERSTQQTKLGSKWTHWTWQCVYIVLIVNVCFYDVLIVVNVSGTVVMCL